MVLVINWLPTCGPKENHQSIPVRCQHATVCIMQSVICDNVPLLQCVQQSDTSKNT